jgi:branched-chain amino acid transport system ATP-binding protein
MVSAEPLLRLDQLEVAYHQIHTAVQGVSLRVARGAIVALLGTNGAGKTTTLRAISGFIGMDDARIVDGDIRFDGSPIGGLAPHRTAALGIVLVPERDKVFETLSVLENLEASLHSLSHRTRNERLDRSFAYFPKLADLRQRKAGYLSGGERQMLTLAAALACGPRLLLVDELSLGLAPAVVAALQDQLLRIHDDLDVSMLLVEQDAAAALQIADYGYVMEHGRVVLDGTPERLLGHSDIREFYLGQGEQHARRSYRDVKQYRRSRRWYG